MSGAAQPSIGNPFRAMWNLGYRSLVPVIPHDAALSGSTHVRPASRGKAPGTRRADGTWGAMAEWQRHAVAEDDIDLWASWGASCGLRLGLQHDGTYLHAIDADTLHRPSAEIVRQAVERIFGLVPIRIGQSPKALYLIRTRGALPYRVLRFLEGAIEILGGGKQCVIHGIHPRTLLPYRFTRQLLALADLPLHDAADLERLLVELRAVLPAPERIKGTSSVDRAKVDQIALRGDPETVSRAVAALPNTYRPGGYDDWILVAAAIRAALPEDYGLGLELFEEYTERGGCREPAESAPRVFGSFEAPFAVGAPWLYDQVRQRGDGSFNPAEPWFDEAAAAEAAAREAGGGQASVTLFGGSPDDVFKMLSLAEIMAMPDPEFVIDRHLPERSVGFLYGHPGTGKSFIALDWALHLAFGRSHWHGDTIKADPTACVVYLAGEGAQGFKTRARAWAKRHGIAEAELDGGRFRLLPVGVNMMQPEQVAKLARTIRLGVGRACLVVADTVSRAMPGADENTQKEMTLFVKACDALRDAFDCIVLGVHHANRQGDMRGSSVLTGAGDFVFRLERAKGAAIGKLTCEKQKDAPDGWDEPYRFDVVDVAGGASLVPVRCAVADGPEVGVTPDLTVRILNAMREAWEAGEPWGPTYHAGERHAPKRIVRDFGLDVTAAEDMLKLWLGMGAISVCQISTVTKKKGYRVNAEPAPAEPDFDLFD